MNLDNLKINLGKGMRVSDTVDARKLLAANVRLEGGSDMKGE